MSILSIISLVFSLTLPFIFAIFKAICDLSEEGNLKFKPTTFWLKNIAWVNKWRRDGNGVPLIIDGKRKEQFFGSSRWFVFLTCAWHLFQLLYNRSTRISGVFLGILAATTSYWLLFLFVLQSIIYASTFHIFHTSKILRK